MTKPAPSPRVEDRHRATQQIINHFGFAHLPEHLQVVSREFHGLAHRLLAMQHDGPELTVALRKLRESKDCAVLQAIDDHAAS